MSFRVDPDSELWQPAREVAAEWSYALGRPITVTPDGDIPIFRVEGSCDPTSTPEPGHYYPGCTHDIGTPDARIEISSLTPDAMLRTALRHEMGHILRGSPRYEHTDDPNSVMYWHRDSGAPRTITPADVKFICETFDCDPPPLSPTLSPVLPTP